LAFRADASPAVGRAGVSIDRSPRKRRDIGATKRCTR
jgi:hypothetical protein